MTKAHAWAAGFLVVLLFSPVALGQDEDAAPVVLHAEHFFRFEMNASNAERTLWASWNASAPIDFLVLTSDGFADYRNATLLPDNATYRETNTTAGMRHVALPPGQAYVLVWDNAGVPVGGAAGATNVTISFNAFATNASRSNAAGLARTAALQQPSWLIPGLPGIGVAGPALLFLALAAGCEVLAWRENKRRWIDVGIMVGLGAIFSVFVASRGVVLPDTRLLTIPAIFIGVLGLKRHRTALGAAAGVFAACFWGPLVGGDLLSLALHHAQVEQGWYDQGKAMIIGGAGWRDALVIVPIVGMLGFVFRRFTLLGWIMGWTRKRKRAPPPAAPVVPRPPGRLAVRAAREGAALRLVIATPAEAGVESLNLDVLDAASGLRIWGQSIEVGLGPGAERSLDLQIPKDAAQHSALRVVVRSALGTEDLAVASHS
ncbi:MAG: hypothetical protein QOE90_1538 [Thermoplasmata archaeon]|nr:hypothetical protein [Thermoplasmata archaeon]